MAKVERLSPEALCKRCDPGQFTFETSAELPDLTDILGQARATEAIRFGIGIRRDGYNLFVLGAPGTGRRTIVRGFLERQAAQEPIPADWCYVNNFEQAHRPRVLRLPAGAGGRLRDDMERLMDDLRSAVQGAFESEEYRARRHELEEELKERQERAFDALREEAEKRDIALVRTPGGMAFAPMQKGEVVSPEEFHKLPEADRQRVEQVIASLQERLERIVHQLPQWRREGQRKIHDLDRDVTTAAVGHLIADLKKEYAEFPAVLAYLDAVQESVVENADDFKHPEEGPELTFLGVPLSRGARTPSLRAYQVNVLVDNGAAHGAPVVYEDNPTFNGLVGRIEHLAQLGALLTDFTLVKSGALHRANGGYLVLDARKVLLQPYAWEGLKRCLASREVRIESLGQALSLVSTVSIEPEPIPLDLKVVLVGERLLYYLLQHYDPEFGELFKVAADFDEDMDREDGADRLYAQLVATLARAQQLLPLDRAAVARVIEQAARLAADTDKLTVRLREVTDLLREADHWTRAAGRALIGAADVQRALDAKVYRTDRLRARLQEEIVHGTILIGTDGAAVGQVNGLSVMSLGEFAFGHPSRITARTRLGKGEVLDIQREVELSGPIHSKGVLILAGFLGARYCPDRPLSLAASLTFEQTYGEVEGDSASSAELYALLSDLAEVPIDQSFAVTGSVNQRGEVQAIGGANEKIEGFFDVCRRRGLTGKQGVLIPAANVRHLMLRHDVVQAVAEGKFHVYPVASIDEGIELLTGMTAGARDEHGLFPDGSLNQRVEAKLLWFAEQARGYGPGGGDGESS